MKTYISLSLCLLPLTVWATDLTSQRQSELLYLLKQDCGSCHGLTLQGGLGPSLLPTALTGKPKEVIIQTILKGRPNTAMPPWQGLLTESEIIWLTDQLYQGIDHAAHP
jgi:cytochrome c55X